MGILCFGTYAKLLQSTLAKNSNVQVTELLLGLVIDNEEITNQLGNPFVVTDKHASDLLNCKDNIRKRIKEASGSKKIFEVANDYFEDAVIPEIMPDMTTDLLAEMTSLINSDDTISPAKKRELVSFASQQTLAAFLAHTFLYALKKPNIIPADVTAKTMVDPPFLALPTLTNTIPESDLYLLMEANGVCPTCGKQLVSSKNNNSLPEYQVVQIVPQSPSDKQKTELGDLWVDAADGESYDNNIALCLTCSNTYISHTTRNEREQLKDIKDKLQRTYHATMTLDRIYLEEQIEAVIRRIPSASLEELSDTLNYTALRVREKISANNIPLIIKTEGYVVRYYKFIESVFSSLEREGKLNFRDVAEDVQQSYRKLGSRGLKQDEIYTLLVDWFKKKTNAQSIPACEIIVAFFVQNCEVFHAVSQQDQQV